MNFNINGIFNPENRFWSFIDKLVNLCLLGVLWALFSLPVVTAGAATTALFGYTLPLTEDEEGYVWQTFIRTFRKKFVKSTVCWIGILAGGGFLLYDLYCCIHLNALGALRIMAFAVLFCLIIVFSLTAVWIFPLTVYEEGTIRQTIGRAVVIAIGNPGMTVAIVSLYALFGIAVYYIPVLFMVWFAFFSYLTSYFYRATFRKYLKEEE
ncbi:YesL family protein [Brotaphodocola sp.]|uniref:YesL family protein n=1 Tax=Brotaphodocola sp. TaxID=3073577 RepID=UPI003D7DB5AC